MDQSRLNHLLARIPALESCGADIQSAFDVLQQALARGNKLLLCGNGGSAADADHWTGELLKGFMHKRPLPPAQRRGLSAELATQLQWALPAIPLTQFAALSTAFANDVNPDLVFAQLTLGLGMPGDVLIGLSTSGNSRNVCHAAEVARARGLKVVMLTGRSGGKLMPMSDVCIHVPATETYLVQEYHLPIYHCLCQMLEESFLKKYESE